MSRFELISLRFTNTFFNTVIVFVGIGWYHHYHDPTDCYLIRSLVQFLDIIIKICKGRQSVRRLKEITLLVSLNHKLIPYYKTKMWSQQASIHLNEKYMCYKDYYQHRIYLTYKFFDQRVNQQQLIVDSSVPNFDYMLKELSNTINFHMKQASFCHIYHEVCLS